jgi:hypothetical protein
MPDRDSLRSKSQFAVPPDVLSYNACAVWTVLSNHAGTSAEGRRLICDVLGLDPNAVRTVIQLIYIARYWLGYDAETVLRALDPLRNREDIPA